jgi:hypothetical protein
MSIFRHAKRRPPENRVPHAINTSGPGTGGPRTETQQFCGTCPRCTARHTALFERLVRRAQMTCPYCAADVPLVKADPT